MSAIVNSRPLASVSTDPDSPFVLSPNVLLTTKLPNPSCDQDYVNFSIKDTLKSEWKRVQGLADQFWSRWKRDYLNLLQPHHKWLEDGQSIKDGDVVLLKDSDSPRNQWPVGVVVEAIPSRDSRVRKVQLKIQRNGKTTMLTRPVSEIVLLLSV